MRAVLVGIAAGAVLTLALVTVRVPRQEVITRVHIPPAIRVATFPPQAPRMTPRPVPEPTLNAVHRECRDKVVEQWGRFIEREAYECSIRRMRHLYETGQL